MDADLALKLIGFLRYREQELMEQVAALQKELAALKAAQSKDVKT